MATMTKLSDTISPQEYEKKRDKVIELLTKIKDECGCLKQTFY
jgi:hypothetical protein